MRHQLFQTVQVVAGMCRGTGKMGFYCHSRHAHKSGTDKLIKLTFDSGCSSCPLSLFHPHSHIYNHLPFHRSSLFNHLLFILPLWHTMYTHMCARTHTPHQHNSFSSFHPDMPCTHTRLRTHTCTCKHTHTCTQYRHTISVYPFWNLLFIIHR